MAGTDGLGDDAIAAILRRTRRIALVGASARPERASDRVMRFLPAHGYTVVPAIRDWPGRSCTASAWWPTWTRRRRSTWSTSSEPGSAAAARGAGLDGAMDRCPAIEWPQLGLG